MADPELRRALTELSAAERADDEPRPARRRELERTIRTLARTRAPRIAPQRTDHTAVADALGDRVMVSFGIADGSLVALRQVAGRLRRFDLGSMDHIGETVQEVRRSLTIHAGDPASPAPLDLLRRLDDLLVRPLHLPDAATVVVVPPALAVVPWPAMPSRTGIPVTVTRSASGWRLADASRTPIRTTVAVDGPRLAHARTEATRVTAVTGATHLAATATVDETLDAIDGSDVLHVASHGRLRSDSPLFSSLELHGGNLSGYHLLRLHTPPTVAVLSACHLGLGAGPGESLLGFTDAFLSAGTSSVIASTLPVPDTAITVDLMVDLHTRMAAGERPASALANAQAAVPEDIAPLYAAAFTCFGAG